MTTYIVLAAKFPGGKKKNGTSTNLPVTHFNLLLCGSERRHHTVSLCSELSLKHVFFRNTLFYTLMRKNTETRTFMRLNYLRTESEGKKKKIIHW